jgi:hypothetical protein
MPRPQPLLTDLKPLLERFALELAQLVQARTLNGARTTAMKALSHDVPGGRKLVVYTRRRALRITPARRRALHLHGKYIGALRSVAKADKERVKARYRTQGVEAALKLAAALAPKERRR